MKDKKQLIGTISGVLLAVLVATIGYVIAGIPAVRALGFSPLVIAIVVGMIVGNLGVHRLPGSMHQGIAFAQKRILRFAIIFYGFRVTFQEIAGVGGAGLLADIIMLTTTFVFGTWIGRRFFGLDRDTAILCAAGSSICGAAAVLATEPVLKAEPYKVTVAVGTVVVFGTIAMFVYPLIFQVAGMNPQVFGIYTGSTVHEVAHVVAVGGAVGHGVAETAVIVKLTRVMLLAPFLLILSAVISRREKAALQLVASAVPAGVAAGNNWADAQSIRDDAQSIRDDAQSIRDDAQSIRDDAPTVRRKPVITIPWFAVLFIAVAGIHSLVALPHPVVGAINLVDTFLLATAMAALGIDSRIERFRGVGAGPILATLTMFGWLVVGGYLVNRLIAAIVG